MIRPTYWRLGDLASLYPAGIPIGRVTYVGTLQTDLYQQVQIESDVMVRGDNVLLGAVVQNLLEMTRLESGAVHLRRDWHPLEEVVGAAVPDAVAGVGVPEHQITRPRHLTPMEFSDSLAFLPSEVYHSVRRLTEVFYRIRYGRHELSAGQREKLRLLVGSVGDVDPLGERSRATPCFCLGLEIVVDEIDQLGVELVQRVGDGTDGPLRQGHSREEALCALGETEIELGYHPDRGPLVDGEVGHGPRRHNIEPFESVKCSVCQNEVATPLDPGADVLEVGGLVDASSLRIRRKEHIGDDQRVKLVQIIGVAERAGEKV